MGKYALSIWFQWWVYYVHNRVMSDFEGDLDDVFT
jgi:hypothetical protein